ncbi:MAG: hypothetical protein CME62_13115 [Halobacteriovoraceae bacterium]|nr:hypothetical protein [Halobacteriovoraceae bacterium]|tara:strand:- start:18656 stop:19960 length:1305 start_codon:yes stop_codon:yes gene_type:complete
MNKDFKQKGIGFIQVLVGLAAVGVIGTYLTQTISNDYKYFKSEEYKSEIDEYLGQMSILLSNREACINSLAGKSALNSSDFTELKDNTNATVINDDSLFGVTGVQIDSFKLEDLPGMDDGVNTVLGGFGTTHLVVNFAVRHGTFFVKSNVTRKLKINTRASATGEVDSTCYAALYSPAGAQNNQGTIWQRQAADSNSIHYSEGKVGAQNPTPTIEFDLFGKLQIQQDGQNETPVIIPPYDKMLIDSVASNYLLNLSANKPLIFNIESGGQATLAARIASTTGAMILGSGGTCNASSEGAIRYGTASRRVEVCRGGVWRRKKVIRYCLAYDPDRNPDDTAVNESRYNNDEGATLSNTIYGVEGEECGRHQVIDPDSPGGNFKGTDNNLHIVHGDPDVPKNLGSRDSDQVLRFDDSDHWTPCYNTRNCRDWIPAHQ